MSSFSSTDVLSKIKSYLQLAAAPKVTLSPLFFRELKCPADCGSCCHPIDLEYLEFSNRWEELKKNRPEFAAKFTLVEENGIRIWRFKQPAGSKFCILLDQSTGRCTSHSYAPFPCKFAPIKFLDRTNSLNKSILITTFYGRAFSFKKPNGLKGADCQITHEEFTEETYIYYLELLNELNEYATVLGVETKLPEILEYLLSIFPEIPKTEKTF